MKKYLIAGLGNIGDKYTNTRHNIGFMILDQLAKDHEVKFETEKLGDIAKFRFKGRTFILLKPNTYMNLSGKAVLHWIKKENILGQIKSHTIKFHIDEELFVFGVETELRSACSNLVFNAVHYTPAGGEINVYWRRSASGAQFSVVDNGDGIEQNHLNRLTERFYRVDASRSIETGGTGLGLAIVKHILARHDARLHISSRINQGSTFSAIFPKERVHITDNDL